MKLTAATPRSARAIVSSAAETRSPVVSSMSISRPGRVRDTWPARAIRLSVALPIAETTTTTSWPWRLVIWTFSATARMRSGSATDVPPYFWTIRATGREPTGARALGPRVNRVPGWRRIVQDIHHGVGAGTCGRLDMDIIRLTRSSFVDTRWMGPRFLLRHLRRRCDVVAVQIKGVGRVLLRRRTSDAEVFSQVFAQHQYELRGYGQFASVERRVEQLAAAGRRPLVLDLGANNGASAMWFARMFPTARVVAVEPDPGNVELCRLNTRGYDVEVIPAAIGSTPGAVDLSGDTWGVATARDEHGAVPVTTIAEIAEAQGDDVELLVVKIDIEGFEDDLFADHTEWVRQAQVVIIEPHDWMLPGRHSSHHFQRVLGSEGFDLIISGENLIYMRAGDETSVAA